MANDKKSGQGTAKAKAPARPRAKKTTTAEPAKTQLANAAAAEHVDKGSLEEQIRRRAHEISLSHNGPGNPEQDWLQAEHEILGKRSK